MYVSFIGKITVIVIAMTKYNCKKFNFQRFILYPGCLKITKRSNYERQITSTHAKDPCHKFFGFFFKML